ncbi:HEPN domain-containing protein [Agrococcus baldri]|uniref:HEPN domain-containing protein n=1 Tax=Agrococcus baldri TaxID=153730 RepID=A0AA94HLR8_9MICO|nr:HEPN domain-containing protein [Agrococcus baldri]SFS08720.1 HEPN domain-containing protein [Agrococcus baldri]
MTPGWQQGRAELDAMLQRGQLQRAPASAELVFEYLHQAQAHLGTASRNVEEDPVGAFQLAYDAARKALASLLLMQGLRPTASGGHIVVYDAVFAQFGSVLGDVIRPFGGMRRLRNSSEYPSVERPIASEDDAWDAIEHARAMVEAAWRLRKELPIY